MFLILAIREIDINLKVIMKLPQKDLSMPRKADKILFWNASVKWEIYLVMFYFKNKHLWVNVCAI